MRTDAVDLDIHGTAIRVICEDRPVLVRIRSALSDHLIDEPAPAGFVVQIPTGTRRLHVLLDRSGFVLGRTRTIEECLAILGSHLAALIPPPPGTVRIRLRALLGEDSTVTLAGFPLFTDPPLIERRLEQTSTRIVDRLAADVSDNNTLEMAQAPWHDLAALPDVRGHTSTLTGPLPVKRVLIPGVAFAEPTKAQAVTFLADAIPSTASRLSRIESAERLAVTSVEVVSLVDAKARYLALRDSSTGHQTHRQ